jgi:hypothetical protein
MCAQKCAAPYFKPHIYEGFKTESAHPSFFKQVAMRSGSLEDDGAIPRLVNQEPVGFNVAFSAAAMIF